MGSFCPRASLRPCPHSPAPTPVNPPLPSGCQFKHQLLTEALLPLQPGPPSLLDLLCYLFSCLHGTRVVLQRGALCCDY